MGLFTKTINCYEDSLSSSKLLNEYVSPFFIFKKISDSLITFCESLENYYKNFDQFFFVIYRGFEISNTDERICLYKIDYNFSSKQKSVYFKVLIDEKTKMIYIDVERNCISVASTSLLYSQFPHFYLEDTYKNINEFLQKLSELFKFNLAGPVGWDEKIKFISTLDKSKESNFKNFFQFYEFISYIYFIFDPFTDIMYSDKTGILHNLSKLVNKFKIYDWISYTKAILCSELYHKYVPICDLNEKNIIIKDFDPIIISQILKLDLFNFLKNSNEYDILFENIIFDKYDLLKICFTRCEKEISKKEIVLNSIKSKDCLEFINNLFKLFDLNGIKIPEELKEMALISILERTESTEEFFRFFESNISFYECSSRFKNKIESILKNFNISESNIEYIINYQLWNILLKDIKSGNLDYRLDKVQEEIHYIFNILQNYLIEDNLLELNYNYSLISTKPDILLGLVPNKKSFISLNCYLLIIRFFLIDNLPIFFTDDYFDNKIKKELYEQASNSLDFYMIQSTDLTDELLSLLIVFFQRFDLLNSLSYNKESVSAKVEELKKLIETNKIFKLNSLIEEHGNSFLFTEEFKEIYSKIIETKLNIKEQ